MARCSFYPELLLSVAKANDVSRVLVPDKAAGKQREVLHKRPVQLAGLEVVGVKGMRDVLKKLWGQQQAGRRGGAGGSGAGAGS